MKFDKIALLFCAVVAAVAVPEENKEHDAELSQAEAIIEKRGFGCPTDEKCHSHCVGIDMRAGYCSGPFSLRCVCTK
ncbi:hypothetical protein TRICI_005530 [Trichomonascus ciferrii]|uniref:Invertebrate defensins family profile domain-containing protein n=1 Tax=Trichomonascus ciferrii TaxID=44093 RepID=A0A642UU19_9ASCO|nr:hypothetical protein TRICI_005530 [Trichomonascus ciferrii]